MAPAPRVLAPGSPETCGMDPARVQHLRALGASWLKAGEMPSFVMLVARHGTVVLHEAFGVRQQDDTLATLRTDSIFTVASCSKPITAALVMCLVEDGLIGLNRPFIDYVPEWNVPGVPWLEEASVADLLRHTSGIDDLALGPRLTERAPDLPDPAAGQHPALNRLIRLSAGVPLARRPGTAMLYSNLGFSLAADIVRRVSGRPFWQFARERLFEPLGMRDSHYRLPHELRERRVRRRPGMPGTAPLPGVHGGSDSPDYDELDFGSGGVASTAGDVAIFLQMLLNGGTYAGRRVLSPATVAAMTRPQVDASIPWVWPLVNPRTGGRMDFDIKGGGYGYGLFLFGASDRFWANGILQSPRAFGHLGYASAYYWADPEYDLVGVLLGVVPRLTRDLPVAPIDLFQNAVYGAIVA
jgi:CubicO group peptidase (beta-lactamase class C family)